MSAKTKIVVVHMKELIYTGIFAVLGILFVILLVMMFLPKGNDADTSTGMPDTENVGLGVTTGGRTDTTVGSATDTAGGLTETANANTTNATADTDNASAATTKTANAATNGEAVSTANTGSTAENIIQYIPGIYTTELVLGEQSIDVEVIVDKESITSIRMINLDEAVTTMYPLLQPTFDSITEQVYQMQTLEGVTYSTDSKYTSLVLLEAIQNSLNKATLE